MTSFVTRIVFNYFSKNKETPLPNCKFSFFISFDIVIIVISRSDQLVFFALLLTLSRLALTPPYWHIVVLLSSYWLCCTPPATGNNRALSNDLSLMNQPSGRKTLSLFRRRRRKNNKANRIKPGRQRPIKKKEIEQTKTTKKKRIPVKAINCIVS